MLTDEPLASLDASRRHGLREEIGALVRSLDLTTVYVTHDQVEALAPLRRYRHGEEPVPSAVPTSSAD